MTKVVTETLENEMDLVLAHKRSMKVAEKLEHTDNGQLNISLDADKQRYSLTAAVEFENTIQFTNNDAGYYYARKLVPQFRLIETDTVNIIEMKIGLPRSLQLDKLKINALIHYFEHEEPINAYDEIKQRNDTLNRIALQKDEELRQSKIIDEKKTEFISIASHEIKTPITIIKAYTQIAQRLRNECSGQVSDLLDKVDFQTTKLLSLIQQLLDISKIENGNLAYSKELVSLNGFIREMIAVIENIVPRHRIVLELDEDQSIFIDKIRMEQVFSNLMVNAAKYSGTDTEIEVRSSIDHSGFVQIAIKDQGIGMTERSMESIFNKFYRDADVITTHSGLGMGLYIASKIVIDHVGRIWAESVEGAGSIFFFPIPQV